MRKALIVVDVQNDFTEGGSLAVEGGAEIAKDIADLIIDCGGDYVAIIATKDWHPDDMNTFKHFSKNPDYKDTWPRHCVAGTNGAALHTNLSSRVHFSPSSDIFLKGQNKAAYSGFEGYNALGHSLDKSLKSEEIDTVDVVGLATDYCVKATALDAKQLGYKTNVLIEYTAGVAPDSTIQAIQELHASGISIVDYSQPACSAGTRSSVPHLSSESQIKKEKVMLSKISASAVRNTLFILVGFLAAVSVVAYATSNLGFGILLMVAAAAALFFTVEVATEEWIDGSDDEEITPGDVQLPSP